MRFRRLARLCILRTAAGERGAELVPMLERRVVVVVAVVPVDEDEDASFAIGSVSLDDRDCKESSFDRLLSFLRTAPGERDVELVLMLERRFVRTAPGERGAELMLLERDRDRVAVDDDVSFVSDSVSSLDRLLSFLRTTAGERGAELVLLARDRIVVDGDASFVSDSVSLVDRDRNESS